MNRAERRKLQRRMKGENVFMDKGVQPVDHSKSFYCHRHKLKFDDPEKMSSERDKRLIESIALKPFKGYDKNGKVMYGRMCGRCHFTINVEPEVISDKSILIDDLQTQS